MFQQLSYQSILPNRIPFTQYFSYTGFLPHWIPLCRIRLHSIPPTQDSPIDFFPHRIPPLVFFSHVIPKRFTSHTGFLPGYYSQTVLLLGYSLHVIHPNVFLPHGIPHIQDSSHSITPTQGDLLLECINIIYLLIFLFTFVNIKYFLQICCFQKYILLCFLGTLIFY